MPITVKEIEAARFGVSKERLSDGGGLYLRLAPSGAKTFQAQIARTVGSSQRGWITLGTYPSLSLKAARGLAAQVRAMSEAGQSIEQIRAELSGAPKSTAKRTRQVARVALPRREKQSLSEQDWTLHAWAEAWFRQKRPSLSNGKHVAQNWSTVASYVLPKLGVRPVAAITKKDVVETFRPIWHSKHVTAKRTLGRLREIFELANLSTNRSENPAIFCHRTAFGYTRQHSGHFAALDFERMPDFWQWLCNAECEERIRQATQLLVLCAKRTGETRFAEWRFFSDGDAVWTTPDRLMKARLRHRVPMSLQAQEVLVSARALSGGERLVFAKQSTINGTISENAILNLVKRFEPSLTGHGFRASFKTWARRQRKYHFDAVEYALAHVPNKLAQAYMRDDLLEERREIMQDWANYVTGAPAVEGQE